MDPVFATLRAASSMRRPKGQSESGSEHTLDLNPDEYGDYSAASYDMPQSYSSRDFPRWKFETDGFTNRTYKGDKVEHIQNECVYATQQKVTNYLLHPLNISLFLERFLIHTKFFIYLASLISHLQLKQGSPLFSLFSTNPHLCPVLHPIKLEDK